MFFYKRIIILELIICFIILFQYYTSEKRYNNFEFDKELIGTLKIISTKEETDFKNKYFIKYKNIKFILYTEKEFEYGDILYFQGYFEKAKTFKNFKFSNYAEYLKEQRVYGFLRTDNLCKIAEKKDIFYYLECFKNKLKQNLFDVFNDEQAGFLEGLLLGDKTDILDETKKDFQNSSLSHVLAISGLHIIYVALGISSIINLFTNKKRLKNKLMIFLLIFFAFFTGGSPSCLRACIMISMVYFAELIYHKNNLYISMLIALDIILLINCYYIHSFSLWLSFLATFGIVYFKNLDGKNYLILDCLKISIISNLMNIPITIGRYNTISITFLISNLFASIFIGPIIILGYIHLFLGRFSLFFSFIEKSLLNLIFGIARFLGKLKISKIPFPSFSIIFWIIYYTIILLIGYLYHHKEFFQKNKKQILNFIMVLIFVRYYCFNSQKKRV